MKNMDTRYEEALNYLNTAAHEGFLPEDILEDILDKPRATIIFIAEDMLKKENESFIEHDENQYQ